MKAWSYGRVTLWGLGLLTLLSGPIGIHSVYPRDAESDQPPPTVADHDQSRSQWTNAIKRGQGLGFKILTMIRSFRYSKFPGSDSQPSAQELESLRREFLEWKSEVQTNLGNPNYSVPTELRITLVNTYFNQFSQLFSLHTLLQQNSSIPSLRPSLRSFSFEPHISFEDSCLLIPMANLKNLPGLLSSSESRLGERFFPILTKPLPLQSGKAQQACLRLNQLSFQAIRMSLLLSHSQPEGFFTLVQYLSIRQLYQNWINIRELRGVKNPIPEFQVPQELKEKFEFLGNFSNLAKDQRIYSFEAQFRTSLIQVGLKLQADLPGFVNDRFVEEIGNTLFTDPDLKNKVFSAMKGTLESSEHDLFIAALETEIQSSSILFSALDQTEFLPVLTHLIFHSKANLALNRVMDLVSRNQLRLSLEMRSQIIAAVELGKEKLKLELNKTNTIQEWIFQAQREAKIENQNKVNREKFLLSLLKTSQQLRDLVPHFVDSFDTHSSSDLTSAPPTPSTPSTPSTPMTLDLVTWIKALASNFEQLNPRDSVRKWIGDIAYSGNYGAGRKNYFEIVDRILPTACTQWVTKGELVQLKKLKECLVLHPPKIDQPLTNTSPDLAQVIQKRIIEGRQKDLLDLLKMGIRLGFHRGDLGEHPSLAEALVNLRDRKLYIQTLESLLQNRFPILSLKVRDTLAKNQPTVLLSEALSAHNEKTGEHTQALMDQALSQLEENIQSNIQKILKANNLKEIEPVVTSALTMQIMLKGFQEFFHFEERFVDLLITPTFTKQVLNRYVSPYLGWGFSSLLLMHISSKVITKSAPYVEIINYTFGPYLRAFFKSAIALVLADSVHMGQELWHLRENTHFEENLYFSDGENNSLIQYEEFSSGQNSYEWSKWLFAGKVAMDTGFLYYPVTRSYFQALRVIKNNHTAAKRVAPAIDLGENWEEKLRKILLEEGTP